MTTDLHAHVRTVSVPTDPLHCRRAEDRDRIAAQAASWKAFQEAVHAGRTVFEAHAVSCRVHYEELATAAVRRMGVSR
jgi:hypothetical protein